MVKEIQNNDPLCQRILKEIAEESRKGFKAKDGVLDDEDKLYILQQKALIFKLMYIYHDD